MDQNGKFSMEEAKRIAQSDAGRQLMALLQQKDARQLQNAAQQASAGNFEEAKDTLSSILSSPDVQALLKQLGG